MKRILTSAVALTLLIGTPALAQKDHDKGGGGGKHQGQADAPAKPDRGGGGGGGGKHDGDRGDRGGGGGRHDGRGDVGMPGRGGGGVDRGGRDRNDRQFDRDQNRGNPNWNRNDNRNQNWNRNDRNQNWNRNNNRNPNWNRNQQRPRNFDRRAYQRNVYAQHRFRGGFYRKPPGWYYRRWSYGQILPFAFFASNYWLNDYYAYDLPIPPYGYEWVRYGDDAILVDVRTGMILQVMYGVFY